MLQRLDLLLAQSVLNPAVLALMIPIIAIVGGITVAVVSVFTAHQRKMAELFRADMAAMNSQGMSDLANELRSLRANLASMQDQLNQVTINSDSRKPSQTHYVMPEVPSEDVRA